MENEKFLLDLRKKIAENNIKIKEPMSKHTSFKTGGQADYYIIAKTTEEIEHVVKCTEENKIKLYIMGNGSNILVSDQGLKGAVLKIALEDINIEKKETEVIILVGAGTKIMALAQKLKQEEITGFEELAGIPGTAGGANYMNAGAYGKEIQDILIETKVLNKKTKKIEILKNEQQNLSYRNSIFKNNEYIILELKLKLQKGNKKEIEKNMQQYMIQRKEKQPIEYPSAGSTFKKGEGYITSKLIDECGLKGYSIGGAQISEKHAGFIINRGNATTQDILELIEYTKKKVFEKHGIQIYEEIEIFT